MQSYHFLQAELQEGWYKHIQWLAVGYITGDREALFAELKSPLMELHFLWMDIIFKIVHMFRLVKWLTVMQMLICAVVKVVL